MKMNAIHSYASNIRTIPLHSHSSTHSVSKTDTENFKCVVIAYSFANCAITVADAVAAIAVGFAGTDANLVMS